MTGDLLIGIDLGGTNVRAGAVTRDGRLLAARETPIEARRGPQAGLEKIAGLAASVAQETGGRPLAIGIGATGPVDPRLGTIHNPFTLPTWEDVDIVSPLRQRFGIPVVLENDADAAALGESWQGAGQGQARLLMVTVGTGVGTAFILNGEIYRGIEGFHGEGGHILLDPSGPECYCGGRGCLESLAAGPAIARQARDLAARQPTLLLDLAGGDPQKIDARLVANAARQGDALALQVLDRAATYLGQGLVTMILLTLPDCIVLTGGVMRSFDLLEARLRAVLHQHNVLAPTDRVQLSLARLGQQAGMVGAARAALQHLETEK